MENGFPELTTSYLSGQDIFYVQFNNIEFYMEDMEQENFYFNILKKLFPEIKFEKIFPLNGKPNVINEARNNIGNKSKVYIVDLDFDGILESKIELDNLFYLKKYSIENYLVQKGALFEIIREKNSRLKNFDIESLFDYNEHAKQCKILLSDISCSFILIQKYSLGKAYFRLSPARDFNFNTSPPSYKNLFINNYLNEVETLLKGKDNRYTFNGQLKKLKKHFNSIQNAFNNIPGKYLLILLKYKLERLKLIYQVNLDSFNYKLSKECSVNELEYLKLEINKFIN